MGVCAFIRVMDPKEEQRVWLMRVLDAKGLAPTALAIAAGLAPTTLTRFLNNPEHASALSARTIAAIERQTGVRFGGANAPAQALREREAVRYVPTEDGDVPQEMLETVSRKANGLDPWVLRSRALEAAGYMPQDILVVDLNARPQPGDIVCAQAYDWKSSNAETLFRIWEPPSLVTATYDPMLRKALVVDDHNVMIRGVVVASLRRRQGRAAA
jgi:hypothetical protein